MLGVSLSATGFLAGGMAAGHPSQVDQKDEHDPAKRSERFLEAAEAAFDNARMAYTKDDVHTGDARLDEMISALQNCVAALDTAHKSRLYKRAEMRVSSLQRRMQSLLDEISITQRGWAEQTGRKLEEVHDKLLEGAMKK
jgi:predicted lipid-binding transport protein (Tim44 family)